jgi:Trehalose utilisation
MKSLLRLVAVLCLTMLAARAADKRILLLAGRPSHPPGMHEFRAGCLLLQKCLTGFPGVTVEVYSNGWPTKVVGTNVVDDDAVFNGASAVLIYADGGGGHPAIKPERLRLIDSLAARGVGLGFAHYGVEVPAGEPGAAMHRWVGGYYENLYSVNPMWSPKYEKFPNHPIARGVKPFSNRDEWYFNMRWTTDEVAKAHLTPILTATPGDEVRKGPYVYPAGPYPHIVAASGREETLMWAFQRPDGGRGFGFTGGHTHQNWANDSQRKAVLNALLWIAKVEVPANGVESSVTEDDLKLNLDIKGRR